MRKSHAPLVACISSQLGILGDRHFGTQPGTAGQTAPHPAMVAKGDVLREVIPGIAWQNGGGNVLGVYMHGLFEDAAVLQALFGAGAPSLDAVFAQLAADVGRAFATGVLQGLIQ